MSQTDNLRPKCEQPGCSNESTTRCCYHKVFFCTAHSDDHNDGHYCYWSASVPIKLQSSTQMTFGFEARITVDDGQHNRRRAKAQSR